MPVWTARLTWIALLAAFIPCTVRAAPPEWWPRQSPIFVTVERPATVIHFPLVRDVAGAVAASPQFQVDFRTVDRLRLEQARLFLERSLGTTWDVAVDRLVVRAWMGVGLPARPGAPASVLIVVESRNADDLKSLLDSARTELANQRPPIVPDRKESHSREWFQLGDVCWAQLGRFLMIANEPAGLESLLATPSLPPDTVPPDRGKISVEANLQILRQVPAVSRAFAWPTNNAGLAVIAGGYADLLRRASKVEAELRFDEPEVSLRIQADAGTEGLPQGLKGFFATDASPAPAPLLRLPRTIASASWIRDYAPVWKFRHELMTAAAYESAEREFEKQRSRNGFGPEEVTSWIGTRWRAVVARQGDTVYRRQPAEKLPAVAIAVDLRNETSFVEKVFPMLDRLARGPITLVFGYPRNSEYQGAKITSVRIKEPDDVPAATDYRYSLSPAMTVARGHFVIGSTEGIVHQVIDELIREPAESPSGPPRLAWRQVVNFRELVPLAEEFRESFLRTIVLQGGLTVAEAEQNAGALATVLQRLGELHTEMSVTADRFKAEFKLRPQ